MLDSGRVLNHYEIVRLLGKGGMGEVYVARDRKLGREVALKVLPEELAGNDERRERFEREARAVAALRHPNIVTLHSIEEVEGMTFLVMELVDGKPLSELIPRGGFALDRFLKIAVPLADAVAAAHARGITHRDLKPANVLVDSEGRIQVLDFGLAKVSGPSGLGERSIEPTEALTGEGKIVGTIAYMSPEQVEGKAVDPRSDIFSLGVLFYELVTGGRPFEGETGVSLLTSILRDEPVPVTERNQRLPRYLGRIVKRCLQKEPSRRYQSALDLRNDLVELREELSSGELAAPETSVAPTRGTAARFAFAIAVSILVIAGVWWLVRRAGESSTGAASATYEVRRLTVRGSPGMAAISPDGRYVAYTAAAGGWSVRLQQIASGSDIELARGDVWNVVFGSVAFTPDGEYVRYVRGGGGAARTLWEVPVLGGAPRRLVDGILVGPIYSPDGDRVAFVPGTDFTERWRRLDVVSLADGSRRTVLEFPEGGSEIEDGAWSPDGSRLALGVTGSDVNLVLLSLESGATEVAPGGRFATVGGICWSPDGDQLIVLGHPGPSQRQIWGVDLRSRSRRLLVPDVHSYQSCSMTADGRLLATVREQTHAQIWIVPLDDPDAARPVPTTTGRSDGVSRVAWVDAETLAYGGPDRDSWNLWQVAANGGTSIRLTDRGADVADASDDGRLVFESGWETGVISGIYALEPGGGQRRLSPEGRWARRPALSPDGQWVFYELLEDRMHLVRSPWEGGEPQVVTKLLAHLPSVSPDGSRVAVHVRDRQVADTWQTAIFPLGSDTPERVLDIHSETYSPWASDDSLFVSRTTDGVANIFRVNLDTLAEEQVTFFADGEIFSFDVSPDLTRLAVGRGEVVNDLLLIEGLLGAD